MFKKYKELYLKEFLPLMESIFQYKTTRGQDLVVNESNLGLYFDVHRDVIKSFLDEMELNNLIKYVGSKRIFDEFQVKYAMRCYQLIKTESKYCSTLQEFINTYMLWEPYLNDRLSLIIKYTEELHEKKLKIAKDKIKQNKPLSSEEKKLLKKQELNMIYQQDCNWAVKLLERINLTRPEIFKSKYLAEGRNRETNVLCGSLNPDKEHVNASEEDLAERHLLLASFFGSEDFEQFDTNGSIYRLSFALSMKRPLEHDVDIYEAIWKKAYYKVPFTKTIRNALKVLMMPIFMSNGRRNAWNAMLYNKKSTIKSEIARKIALDVLVNATKNEARTVLDELTVAMKKYLNVINFLEEEIFIYESNLHILMITEFMRRNIQTINVYDGFYFIKGTCNQQIFNEVYDLCTNQLLEKMQ